MMLPLDFSQETPIQYQPLPENAFDAARDGVVSLGFSDEAILKEYSFSTRERQSITVNALAFAHPKHRIPTEYASFTIYNVSNGLEDRQLVQILAQTAAPFHLIHREDRFSFWASGVENQQVKPVVIESDINYAQLTNALNQYAIDLKPEHIIDVKQGRAKFSNPVFADMPQPLQLSLWAANVTRPLLVEYFGKAVSELREYLNGEEYTVVDIATQLLGAAILADTGVLGDTVRFEQNLRLDQLIRVAHHNFPNYFKEYLFKAYSDSAERAYKVLRQIRYVGFAPEMLTEIYREAYSQERRKELGRYDTPLYLTRRIWENIPVEFLSPEQRVAVDMTCGWGSFLLAGYKRLSPRKDMQGISLRNYLRGNDVEPLAARLAGLGLLVSTSEDSWHIDHEDAMAWTWLRRNQPNIIVGNPPFRGDRKTIKGQKGRYQEADKYLEHAVNRLADGGYLAMVMPQSFVAAQSVPDLRRLLLEKCDVQELWDLPLGTFDAATNAVVIFARKKEEGVLQNNFPVRVRTLQVKSLEKFEQSGIFTASSIVSKQSSWRKNRSHIMDYQQILSEYTWRDITSRCVKLEKWAFVAMGAIVGDPTKGNWKNYPKPKIVNWLTGANVIPKSFSLDYGLAKTITYPNDFVRPGKHKRYPDDPKKGKEHLFIDQKVLLISDPNPSWGKRIKVAIERRGGYYVSNTFYMVKARPSVQASYINNDVIAAVLDWYVCNAWVVEHLKYPWVEKRVVQRMPFPKNLSKVDCQILSNVVRQIEDAINAGLDRPPEATQAIDQILIAAYQLDRTTYERLRFVAEWNNTPQFTLDVQPDSNARWEISGIVENVDAPNGTITLWLNGFDHFEKVPITPVMPGWLLRPEVAFRTTIPRACVRERNLENVSWGKFYPQEYTYLSEEELFDQLTQTFYPETETG